jgi:hypothetical protein
MSQMIFTPASAMPTHQSLPHLAEIPHPIMSQITATEANSPARVPRSGLEGRPVHQLNDSRQRGREK